MATAVTNTATGWTAGVQATTTAGGTAIEWYTPQLQAATLSGIVQGNIWASESNAAAEATVRLEVAVVDNDGTNATVYGSACPNSELLIPETGLLASDAADSDQFGYSVACSANGSVAVVGALYKDGAGIDRGKVYIYSGSNWGTETGKTASDAGNSDYFGSSVSCSADGSIVVVGAYGEDGAGTDRGKVYIYSGTNWGTETGKTASDTANGDQFGISVACSGDGSVVVVGAFTEDGAGTNRGKVYIYSGSNWGTETMLTASDTADNDTFGSSVACSANGSVVVVGAPNEDGAGTDRGKVYVYSGSNWSTETMLTASDAADNDKFGYAVTCSSDGSVVVVGAPNEDGAGTDRGAVYIYSGTTWGTETKKTASDAENNDEFGTSVACSSDGSVVVVGAYLEDGAGNDRGKVYVYSGSNWGTETTKTASDAANTDIFGGALDCSADGSTVVVGAYGKTTNRGKAYIYANKNYPISVAGPSTAIAQGQRLRFRAYLDDYEAALVTGYTATLYYNEATAGNTGDSYVVLPVGLYELASGAPVGRLIMRLQAVSRAATF